MRWICFSMLLLLFACKPGKKETLIVEREVNGYHMRLQYMPAQVAADTDRMYFRLNINGNQLKAPADNRFSYGLDSLFQIVQALDTLHPVDVTRIANGNIHGIEYLLLFDKPAFYPGISYRIVFKDWLFTNQLISFPFVGSKIPHIDSLSLKI